MKKPLLYDCIIIGGGPAGLTAAIYLARYRRNIKVYDACNSRAQKIPVSHNYPGFPEGISGKDLLERLREQVRAYEIPLINTSIEALEPKNGNFLIKSSDAIVCAKNIILSTGLKDIEPPLANIAEGVSGGLIRYCPICDGYEAINKNVAVLGKGKHALEEALFLRDYTSYVTLITSDKAEEWSKKDLKKIHEAKINAIQEAVLEITYSFNKAKIIFSNASALEYDCIYLAFGCIENNKLAEDLNATLKKGRLVVNKDQVTSVNGLFAAGDIVSGLNQICVATSEAAIAATNIHNNLRK